MQFTSNSHRDNNNQVLSFEVDNEDFRMIAIKLHGDQKYGTFPYAYHLAAVEHVLTINGYTEFKYRCAAWLHDALEDTNCTYGGLRSLYGVEIAQMVYGCTGIGESRKDRNEAIYLALRKMPHGAPVKVADRIANMKEGIVTGGTKQLRKYVEEWEEFSANVRPLMTGNRRDSLLWNKLEETVATAKGVVANFVLAA